MDGTAAQFFLLFFIALVIYYSSFTPEKKAARRKETSKRFSKKSSNNRFLENLEISKISKDLCQSQIIFPNGSYNQSFDNITVKEEKDFTIYIGDFFYQIDVEKTWLEKNMPRRHNHGTDINPIQYNENNWPSNVPKPHKIDKDYFNYYYFRKLCIIKPNFKTSYPDFAIRLKRLGVDKLENIITLKDQYIFNDRYMLASKKPNEVSSFFNNDKLDKIGSFIDRSYVYETVSGYFVIKSESTFFDSFERLHKNSLAMLFGFLHNEESLQNKYCEKQLFNLAALFWYVKILAIVFAIFVFCLLCYIGRMVQEKEMLLKGNFTKKFEYLFENKNAYVPELMTGFTWKNTKQVRLIDAAVLDFKHINDQNRERLFLPRFEAIKPTNLRDYPQIVVPRIKQKLGYIRTYYSRTYNDAIKADFRCDSWMIVDTNALWTFIGRYYAQADDLETAFLLSYAGIVNAYECENNTADSMTIENIILLMEAKKISVYNLLYLTAKYNPNPELLKSIAKDIITISHNQHPCSDYIKYNKELLLEVLHHEIEQNNYYANKLFDYNLVEKFTQEYMDGHLVFAEDPYPKIYRRYCSWDPRVKAEGFIEERIITQDLQSDLHNILYYGKLRNYFYFRKIMEEYLTRQEGVAIAMLCKAFELEKGEFPNNRQELESWYGDSLPVDRFINRPYELHKYQDVKLYSNGPDLKNTNSRIQFW